MKKQLVIKKQLLSPLSEKQVRQLKVGDIVSITGQMVTARDKAYARALELLRTGKRLPLYLRGGIVYHSGPLAIKNKNGWNILSAGPTTSARLDSMQTEFIERTGVRALVGNIADALTRLGCVYLAFTGGAGVLAGQAIKEVQKIFWRDLGDAEALWVLRVQDFGPLVVAVDTFGNNLYASKIRLMKATGGSGSRRNDTTRNGRRRHP
jgi:fumarate hydratase subunit beta